MPQTLKANRTVDLPLHLMGIRNILSNLLFRKPFLKGSRKQQRMISQALAAAVSLAMMLPLTVILYFVIQNFV